MTFTEAAIEVLRREGKPLHFKKLAEIAVREDLLDHVGKIPEETMAGQLAAHCRLARAERRVIAVQPGTFALVEWGLEEDPAGLEGLVELPPEDEPAYRGRERHPMPSRDLARSTGRAEARPRRREEEERRGRRFPPPSEVAYEILAGAGKPLGLVEIAATGAERLLMPDAFVRDAAALRAALTEDNRRREGAGRKALFQLDGDAVTLVAQPEPGERAAPAPAPRAGAGAALGAGAGELRRAALAALRRRLRECDEPTVEHVAMRLLEKLGFRDLKVAKRGREHVVCTGKRRMGLGDVRHAIRILRGGADAGRRDVSDLRRDIGHYGAQIGVVLTPGEAAREARGDAVAAGQLPVLLICGEALAEALADAGVGCVPVLVPEVDEAFFRSAAEVAERDEAARRARREERDRREGREGREGRERREEQPGAEDEAGRVIAIVSADGTEPAPIVEGAPEVDAVAQVEHVPAESVSAVGVDADDGGDEADEGDEGDEEGGEGDGPEGAEVSVGASAGAPGETPAQGGERRRRRRRRRRRGGRGRGPREGAPGDPNAGPEGVAAPAAPPEGAAAAVAPDSAPERPPQPQPPPLPPREPPAGEGA